MRRSGDIIAVTGLGELKISDTICDPSKVEALPALSVDEPTVSMNFCVNTSPFAGREVSSLLQEISKKDYVKNWFTT